MNKKALLKRIAILLSITLAVVLLLTIWLPFLQAVQLVVGLLVVLFVPGYIWSLVFWEEDQIGFIERIALSIALSVTIVPLILFLLYKAGLAITLALSIIEISILTLAGLTVLFYRKKGLNKINFLKL